MRRLIARRLLKLYLGLVLFGVSLALMVEAALGLGPWDVLHDGVTKQTGLSFGWVVIGMSTLVLALWIPLRQRPGLGTASNVVVVGLAVDAALAVMPAPEDLGLRASVLVVGILLNGVATGLYIGAGFGPGPRDGLMTGLAARGLSIRRARTIIELSVLGLGWLLGGSVGVGTILYAVSIGPLAHRFIPLSSGGRGETPAGEESAQRGMAMVRTAPVATASLRRVASSWASQR